MTSSVCVKMHDKILLLLQNRTVSTHRCGHHIPHSCGFINNNNRYTSFISAARGVPSQSVASRGCSMMLLLRLAYPQPTPHTVGFVFWSRAVSAIPIIRELKSLESRMNTTNMSYCIYYLFGTVNCEHNIAYQKLGSSSAALSHWYSVFLHVCIHIDYAHLKEKSSPSPAAISDLQIFRIRWNFLEKESKIINDKNGTSTVRI
jgi:hypothetical protein